MKRASKPAGGVRPLSSALKVFAVLDVLGRSRAPLRLADLVRATGESRATTYQKLVTLVQAGWAEQDDQGAYRLSLHAARVGEAALHQAGLGERAIAVMRELVAATGETVSLAVVNGVLAELVQRVEAEVVVRAQLRAGMLLSLDQSASGRVLTAFASPEQRELLEKKGAKLASATVLAEVRRGGYAVSTGRDVPGVQSIAVPVLDPNGRCLAALSVVAPVARFDAMRYLKPLQRAAERLNATIGGRD